MNEELKEKIAKIEAALKKIDDARAKVKEAQLGVSWETGARLEKNLITRFLTSELRKIVKIAREQLQEISKLAEDDDFLTSDAKSDAEIYDKLRKRILDMTNGASIDLEQVDEMIKARTDADTEAESDMPAIRDFDELRELDPEAVDAMGAEGAKELKETLENLKKLDEIVS